MLSSAQHIELPYANIAIVIRVTVLSARISRRLLKISANYATLISREEESFRYIASFN